MKLTPSEDRVKFALFSGRPTRDPGLLMLINRRAPANEEPTGALIGLQGMEEYHMNYKLMTCHLTNLHYLYRTMDKAKKKRKEDNRVKHEDDLAKQMFGFESILANITDRK